MDTTAFEKAMYVSLYVVFGFSHCFAFKKQGNSVLPEHFYEV